MRSSSCCCRPWSVLGVGFSFLFFCPYRIVDADMEEDPSRKEVQVLLLVGSLPLSRFKDLCKNENQCSLEISPVKIMIYFIELKVNNYIV